MILARNPLLFTFNLQCRKRGRKLGQGKAEHQEIKQGEISLVIIQKVNWDPASLAPAVHKYLILPKKQAVEGAEQCKASWTPAAQPVKSGSAVQGEWSTLPLRLPWFWVSAI